MPVAQLDRVSDSDSEGRAFESHRAYQNISPCYGRGKYFIQLFPPVMGSCFPPTGVKTRKLGFDSDCRGFFGCSNFLGICSKTSRNRSCLQRKLLLRGLVGMLARPLSQFCEHGLQNLKRRLSKACGYLLKNHR